MRTYNNKALLLGLWCGMQATSSFAALTPEVQRKISKLEALRDEIPRNRSMSYQAKTAKIAAINLQIERIKKGEDEQPAVKAPAAVPAARPQFFAHQGAALGTPQPPAQEAATEAYPPSDAVEVSGSIAPIDEPAKAEQVDTTETQEQVVEPTPDASSTADATSPVDATSTNESSPEEGTASVEEEPAQASVSPQPDASASALLKTGAAHEIAMQLAEVTNPAYLTGVEALEGIITNGSQEVSKNQVIELVKLALQPIKTSVQGKKLRSREQKDALRKMLTAGKMEAEKKNKAERMTYKGTPLSGATLGVAKGSDLGLFNDALSQLEKAPLSRALITDRMKPGIELLAVLNEVLAIVKGGSEDFTKDDVMAFLKMIATMSFQTEQEKFAAEQTLKTAYDITTWDEQLRPPYMGKRLSSGIAGIGGDRSDLKNWHEKVAQKTLSPSLVIDNFARLGDRYAKAANYLIQIMKKGGNQYTKDDIMKMLEQAYEPVKNKRLKEQNEVDAAIALFTAAKDIVDEKNTQLRPKYHGEYLGQGINLNSRNIRSWYEAARKYVVP